MPTEWGLKCACLVGLALWHYSHLPWEECAPSSHCPFSLGWKTDACGRELSSMDSEETSHATQAAGNTATWPTSPTWISQSTLAAQTQEREDKCSLLFGTEFPLGLLGTITVAIANWWRSPERADLGKKPPGGTFQFKGPLNKQKGFKMGWTAGETQCIPHHCRWLNRAWTNWGDD